LLNELVVIMDELAGSHDNIASLSPDQNSNFKNWRQHEISKFGAKLVSRQKKR
jgi:hypothetical protein